jgi:integrase
MLTVKAQKGRQESWVITGTVNGERVRKSVKGVDKQQVEIMRASMELGMRTQARAGVTWGDVCDGYVRYRRPSVSVQVKLERLKKRFGGVDVARFDLKEVRDWCVRQGHGDGTVRLMVGHARTVAYHGEKAGMYELARRLSCELPEEPEPRDRYLESEQEIEGLRAMAEPWFRPLVTFLFYTGARIGEARALLWKDVKLASDWSSGEVRLTSRKSRKGRLKVRTVPLHWKVLAELRDMCGGRLPTTQLGPVFRAKLGGAMLAQGVYEPWSDMCGKAGVEDFNPHDARRTFATLLIRKGVPAERIRALLGHDSEGMLKRYAYLAPSQLGEAVAVLE